MKIILTAVLVLLVGCSLIPANKSQTESIKGAQALAATNAMAVHKVIEGEKTLPAPNITVTGSSNYLTIPIIAPKEPYREETIISSSGGVAAESENESSSFWSVQLPVGYSIALVGVGLIIFVVGFKALKRSSTTLSAGFDLADSIGSSSIKRFKSKIASLQDRAGQATDTTEIANAFREIQTYQAEISEIETDRGKAAKQRPAR